MLKTSRRARGAIAAVAFLVAGGAFAEGTFTPELGFGQTSGKHVLSGDGTQRSRDRAFMAAFDAMELRFDRLTGTGTNVFDLQFQVPF
jgi:hypothetical protein